MIYRTSRQRETKLIHAPFFYENGIKNLRTPRIPLAGGAMGNLFSGADYSSNANQPSTTKHHIWIKISSSAQDDTRRLKLYTKYTQNYRFNDQIMKKATNLRFELSHLGRRRSDRTYPRYLSPPSSGGRRSFFLVRALCYPSSRF